MADDFKTSFVDFLKERTTTPLWANFLFSWSIFNWHFLIWILFSAEGNPSLLINQIGNHNFYFWEPVVVAIFLTIIIPILNTGVFYFIEWAKVKRLLIRKNFSNDTWYHYDDYVKKLNEIRQLTEEKERLDDRIRANNDLQARNIETIIKLNETIAINETNLRTNESKIDNYNQKIQNFEKEKNSEIINLKNSLFYEQTEFLKLLQKRDPRELDFLPFMAGVWRNSWGINSDVELAEIKSDSGYYLEGVLAFQLESISYDSTNEKLSFTKISKREGDKRELKNELIISNPSFLEGHEWSGGEKYTISYQRQV